MSKEKQPNKTESLTNHEQIEDSRTREALKSSIEQEANKAERADNDKIEQVRKTIEREATPAEETKSDSNQDNAPASFEPRDRTKGFMQTMTDVRSQLSSSETKFSKIIHQPIVESISETVSKSVGRSSLLLGGFMATFIGSLVIFMNARNNGYSVSNLTFIIVLFVIGAIVGLALEIIYRTIQRFLNSK